MIVFKYKKETGEKNQIIYRPVADVYLKSTSTEWIEFHPYIDSGADITLIPLSLGKLIGLNRDSNKRERISGICGSVPIIYEKCQMRIGNINLSVKIAWTLTEHVPPLLGRIDIFDRFNVEFKQKDRIILFRD